MTGSCRHSYIYVTRSSYREPPYLLCSKCGNSRASALEARRGETGTGSTAEGSDIATAESRDAQ